MITKKTLTETYITFAILGIGIWAPQWWAKIPATLVILFTSWAMLREGDGNADN